MSPLVHAALREAKLLPILTQRREGGLAGLVDHVAALQGADLLALGALADTIRQDEVGDEVFVNMAGVDAPAVHVAKQETGLAFLREVAIARIVGPFAARVRVSWLDVGVELAQVAIGFGANELAGTLVNKRGLPLADGALLGTGKKSSREAAAAVKTRELMDFIRRSGRTPILHKGA